MEAKRKKHKKSIFSRLVKSYVFFLIGTVILYLILAAVMLTYLGNGDINNSSPQTIVQPDGTIADTEVLERIGGWVEELDSDGNVIAVTGNKPVDKDSYSIEELAYILDMGYVKYSGSGVMVKYHNSEDETIAEYSACIRYAGDPKRIFLVCYPKEMVTHKLTYMIGTGSNKRAGVFIGVFFLLFLAGVAGISLYLKKHIDKPLKQLMEGMDEVSEGKRDIVIEYRTDKEFEEIRDKFNLMAEKLKKSEEEKHEIEQNRNQMLLELAHDIKNPVASIKSSICALNEGLVEEDKKKDYYRTIEMKAERIRTLTEDMNTSLKLESDEYKLDLEETDICEVVRRICVEFYEDITSTGKDMDIDIPDEPIMCMLDKKLFGRVINNLLGNANKYNHTGKEVGIKLYKDSDNVVIEVTDDGEAIDEEFVPRMFEAFARGDKTRKTDGGTGLGLGISRKIVEKHKGTLKYIWAENRNCFCIRL